MSKVQALALSVSLLSASLRAQPIGSEFRVNTYTSGDQGTPSVAVDAAGNFVVAWRAHGPLGDYNGPRVQRYDATGAPLGGEFSARSGGYYFTNGGTAVASDSAGDFVVVWGDAAVSGDDELGVFGQRFSAAGAALGGMFHVNTYTTGNQSSTRIAMNATGDFVVVWVSVNEDGDGDGVFGRRFASDGSPRGLPFLVNTYTTGRQANPDAAITSAGDFVISWQSRNGAALYSVYGQRFDASGARSGSEFRVNTHAESGVYSGQAVVAANPTGGFVVVWRTTYFGDADLAARRFDAGGAPLATEFRVNVSTSSYVDFADIAALGSSGYVVTWAGAGKDKLVLGRVLSSTGAPLGSEFVVSTYVDSENFGTAVAANSSRGFVTAWANKGEDGSGLGMYARRFHALANGDANGDGAVDVADVFYLINSLFAGGPAPIGPADVNGDLATDVADVFYLINALFASGPAPV